MAESEASLVLTDIDGRPRGRLRLWLVRERRDQAGRPPPIQFVEEGRICLVEASHYGYELADNDSELLAARLEPSELFEPDRVGASRGRLHTGNRAGFVVVVATEASGIRSSGVLEVASAKLRYDDQFRWMLRDITSDLAEAALARFGPTQGNYAAQEDGEPATLYQRFAFLRAILESDEYRQALGLVLSRPYTAWETARAERSTARGVRASHTMIRALAAPGPRRMLPRKMGVLTAVPRTVPDERLSPTLDNVPNRFIRGLLEDWRGLAQSVQEALEQEQRSHLARKSPAPAPVRRGMAETQSLVDELDVALSTPLFRSVSRLREVPVANQVLVRRPGYRELLRLHQQSQLAASLTWDGADLVFGAGQRDVATLYEYWVFLRLGEVVAEICGVSFDFAGLFKVSRTGLQLNLKKRRAQVVKGSVVRLGKPLHLSLWFNRPFPRAKGESWSRDMRPDLSLGIALAPDSPPQQTLWLHFDAKYRIESLREILGDDSEPADEETPAVPVPKALREDLLKMHAYRDAIRRTSGAYVVYPGDGGARSDESFLEFHELLPGLGAFGLRPTESGPVQGASGLRVFIDDVLDHVANDLTMRRRAGYWSDVVNGALPIPPRNTAPTTKAVGELAFLEMPPADHRVLLLQLDTAAVEWLEDDGLLVFRVDGPPNLPAAVFESGWVLGAGASGGLLLLELLSPKSMQPVPAASAATGESLAISGCSASTLLPSWVTAAGIATLLGEETFQSRSWAEVALALGTDGGLPRAGESVS